jgi:citrate synthase
MSRVSGWIAHAFEQRAANRLIRPQSEYTGPHGRKWTPVDKSVEASARK